MYFRYHIMAQKSDLEAYFRTNNKRLIHKWSHYFDIYEKHFAKYRNTDVVILEIGVSQGGSLQMWKEYFGPKAKIYGVDIDPNCKDLEEENIEIFIGSQSDRKFLRKLKTKIPKVDILLDDGGHTMRQQIVSYEELFDHVKDEGVYLCEDINTSYFIKYGGGFKRRGTFIEYAKNFIDKINADHSTQGALKADGFTRSVESLHFYESVLVVEKTKRDQYISEKYGNLSFDQEVKHTGKTKIKKDATSAVLMVINKVLRALRLPGFIWK